MRSADHTLFLSRLGDQIRFSDEHGSGRKTISYTRDLDYLGSRFGCTPFHLFQDVHDRLLGLVRAARRYGVAAASGTDLVGEVGDDAQRSVVTPFAITCFPAVICPPLRCVNLTGRLVLERFLMSTSVNDYESSVLFLDGPVSLEIEQSRIVGFHGPKALASTVREHYLRVGERFGGDPMTVNSWHSGIYPATFHAGHWRDDVASWAEITFASPRYTHFHTCGVDPGNVATATFDATVRFDIVLRGPQHRGATCGIVQEVEEVRTVVCTGVAATGADGHVGRDHLQPPFPQCVLCALQDGPVVAHGRRQGRGSEGKCPVEVVDPAPRSP